MCSRGIIKQNKLSFEVITTADRYFIHAVQYMWYTDEGSVVRGYVVDTIQSFNKYVRTHLPQQTVIDLVVLVTQWRMLADRYTHTDILPTWYSVWGGCTGMGVLLEGMYVVAILVI